MTAPFKWIIRGILTTALIIAGAFLAFDVFFREPAQHALMNVEGIIALGFLTLLCTRGWDAEARKSGPLKTALSLRPPLLLAIAGAVALAFAPILHMPFVYDDYTHITDASHFTLRSVAEEFGRIHVSGKALFFRPLGFLLYWLNYLWAGRDSTLWHAGNIALHAACAVLVCALCLELGLSWPASFAGALLFGLAGVAAESVAWIDAGFVMLTAVFVLMSLILVCRYAATGRSRWLVGCLVAGAGAMLCKETGFSLPFLIACLVLFKERAQWKRIGRATIFSSLMTAALFAYRWWALNGIGGYSTPNGQRDILHFSFSRTCDALFLRQWAVLFFPFNWSVPANPILRGAVVASPLMLAAIAWIARPPFRPLLGCIAFIVAAALPVQHLLLLSPDLGGSRTLYLGNIGWALLWAFVLDSMPRRVALSIGCLLLALQAAILQHNLTPWRQTAELARSVCAAFGKSIAGTSGPVIVRGLPMIRNGVVFLQNGFPQCVEMNSGVPASRIHAGQSPVSTPGGREFRWDDASGRIQ